MVSCCYREDISVPVMNFTDIGSDIIEYMFTKLVPIPDAGSHCLQVTPLITRLHNKSLQKYAYYCQPRFLVK